MSDIMWYLLGIAVACALILRFVPELDFYLKRRKIRNELR